MAELETEVATILQTAGVAQPGGGAGWRLLIGDLGDNADIPDTVICVRENGGGRRERRLAFARPGFQLLVRGARRSASSTGRTDARAKLTAAIAALEGSEITVLGRRYAWIWAEGGTIPLPRDANDRPIFSQNFTCGREE